MEIAWGELRRTRVPDERGWDVTRANSLSETGQLGAAAARGARQKSRTSKEGRKRRKEERKEERKEGRFGVRIFCDHS